MRSEVIKHEPTIMLGVLSGLVWPQIRVEIDVSGEPFVDLAAEVRMAFMRD